MIDIHYEQITLCKSAHCRSPSIPGFLMAKKEKETACNVGDPGSIPGLGKSPGEGHGNPLQYSCLENPMDRGAWWSTVRGVTKSWTQLSDFSYKNQNIQEVFLVVSPLTA